jgi:hypothetical protein
MLIKSASHANRFLQRNLLGTAQPLSSATLAKRLLRGNTDFFQFSECVVHKLIDFSLSRQVR